MEKQAEVPFRKTKKPLAPKGTEVIGGTTLVYTNVYTQDMITDEIRCSLLNRFGTELRGGFKITLIEISQQMISSL
jgi:hypothetical protein